jgi:hypothetical protein
VVYWILGCSEGSSGGPSDDEEAGSLRGHPPKQDGACPIRVRGLYRSSRNAVNADLLAERTGGYRTGIKGVLADKKWSDELAAKQVCRLPHAWMLRQSTRHSIASTAA